MPVAASPLRVALASDWFLPRLGGIELHLSDLARELEKRGHKAHVVTTTPGSDLCDGVTVRRIKTARLPGSDLAVSPNLTSRLRDALIAGGYDVIHAHVSVISPTGFAAIRAGISLGLPVVVTFHSVLLHAVPLLRALDYLTGWSNAPVLLSGVSELVAGQIRAAGGRDVCVLPNGVDANTWRARRESAGGEILVVSAMRLNSKKRPLPLLEAFARATGGGRPARLIIAGEGPERARIEAAIIGLGLQGRVDLAGALSRPALAALYARADIFVMPSVHESFGLAAIEARFAGLPVIAMRASGSGDFLTDGTTALLADDDAGMATHLGRLLDDAPLRSTLARPDAGLERFTWPNVVRAHEACYLDAKARLISRDAAAPGVAAAFEAAKKSAKDRQA